MLEHSRVDLGQLFRAKVSVHQQADDLWVRQKAATVRMIGAHYYLPWIVNQQVPLESDRPLHGVDEILVLVVNRCHPTTRFNFGIG